MQPGEGTPQGFRLLRPGMIIALAALIAALAGTAVAVDKITSKDIAKNAVRSKHIGSGQVKVRDVNLVRYVRRAGSVEPGRLTPDVRIRAKRGDLLAIHGRVDFRRVAGTFYCSVSIEVKGPIEDTFDDVMSTPSFDPQRQYIGSGEFGDDLGELRLARPVTIPIVEPGPYRVSLGGRGEGGTDCEFVDRNLWVELIR